MSTKPAAPNAISTLLAALTGGKDSKAAIDALEAGLTGTVTIHRGGDRIQLPENMTLDEAITWLTREKLNNETEVAVNETFNTLPVEGAVAFAMVLREKYGFINLIRTPSFFGSKPPHMIAVPTGTGPDDTIQVPWGRMQIPGIEGYLETSCRFDNGRPVFVLAGCVKRASENDVKLIGTLIRNHLRDKSLYRGKAIKIEFNSDSGRDNPFDSKFMPKFMTHNHQTVILNDDARVRLETELYTVIRCAAQCRRNGIPLKRGVLLEGPYGTGKTLTAYDLAQVAVENGWTFIYVDNPAAMQDAIAFSRIYQPAVIFAEDVDKVITEHNDPEMTTVRNALDSVETKTAELLIVLTTNHVDKLPPGFLRHGRIDSVVRIERPDLAATIKLCRHYAQAETLELVATDEELSVALQPLVGSAAASIRECIERAKLSAIRRQPNVEHKIAITAEDLRLTAGTMESHNKFLAGDDPSRVALPHPAVAQHRLIVDDVYERVAAQIKSELDARGV